MRNRKGYSLGRKHLSVAAFALMVFGLFSCGGNKDVQQELQAAKGDYAAEKNLVDTMTLRYSSFNREIVSNGNLRAVKKADLVFKSNGVVQSVLKKDGDAVRKGDTIALLNRESLKLALEQARIKMEQASLDYADKLLGFGYSKGATDIPQEIAKVADIRSGYSSTKHSLKLAELDYANGAIVAPFGGIVANLNIKPYETPSEKVCSVIDNASFDVEFMLLESELNYVQVGQDVRITPYIDLSGNYSGKIRQINPVVDENGQVRVVASIANKGGKLLEGMNVKIFIESTSTNKLVVPKSAVVMRDGYDVLFGYNPSTSKAEWIYVDILESNSGSHVVRGNEQKNAVLEPGTIVIVEGNLNLAEGSKVEIRN